MLDYILQAQNLLTQISTEEETIDRASTLMAQAIRGGHWVNLFGSGHSVIPVMDVFPRYGSFVGFRPLLDPRLMWHTPSGPGGAPELLWLERQPGYIEQFLEDFIFEDGEVFVVYSHGGLNAAPVEAALFAKQRHMPVIAVTSLANRRIATPTHPSGQALADIADIVIDNHVPPEDALIALHGQPYKVGAGSTLAVVAITMTLLVETAKKLNATGSLPPTFVSPNVTEVPQTHNGEVYRAYRQWRTQAVARTLSSQ
ncbi:MAG: sugar isomerase domain-containing protein [Firmicutes bacterium]|nr:sugar isomerase domain-containing protein [Bacillota bacterium]